MRKMTNTTVLRGQGGFTIVEMLVALIVVSIAGTISVQLYGHSYDIGKVNQRRTVGTELAHGQLSRILVQPGAFKWPNLDSLTPGEIGEINVPEGGNRFFNAPTTRPTVAHTSQVEDNFYSGFQWDAYAVVPEADATYVEVTVIVRWLREQERETVSLTSALPRSSIPQEATQ